MIRSKRVILLGAISSFCDLVNEITDLGYEPIICDYYEDAPAKKMGFLSYDISTTDVDKVFELAKEHNADGIISAFSDRNLIPALEVCEKMGFNYFFNRRIIECLTNKINMKSFFASIGVPVVKYAVVNAEKPENDLKDFEYPVITKPIDAYGSKGIFICNNIEEVKEKLNVTIKNSLNYKDKALVEEFYHVDEISITAWVKKGRPYITCIYDVFRNFEDNVYLSAVSFPSKYTEKYYDRFVELISMITHGIGISEGPVTLQCFIGNEGIKVSELLCRLAGGSPFLYPKYFGGPDIAKMLIQYSVKEEIDYQNIESFVPVVRSSDIFYVFEVNVNHKGIIEYSIDIDDIMDNNDEIIDIRIHYPSGSELINVGASGVMFAKVVCKTEKQMDYGTLLNKIERLICVKNPNGDIVSFIRRPQHLDIVNTYTIDWNFLD